MPAYRFSVDVMPKDGILDPQGRAVERSLPHLGVSTVHSVRVGRRVELAVEAEGPSEAHDVVERLAGELFANPLIERWTIADIDHGGRPDVAGSPPVGASAADDPAAHAVDGR
jgi:phosphoribosylformylglycinamidine synthase